MKRVKERRERRRLGVTFEDMPAELRDLPLDASAELKEARAAWLEQARLSLADLMSWLRDRRPGAASRTPSTR